MAKRPLYSACETPQCDGDVYAKARCKNCYQVVRYHAKRGVMHCRRYVAKQALYRRRLPVILDEVGAHYTVDNGIVSMTPNKKKRRRRIWRR